MLEYALTDYLYNDSVLKTYFTNPIYITQVPTSAVMPWLILMPSGGTRTRISRTKLEDINTVRVIVDFPATESDMIKGRNAIERVKYLLENYRGNMGTETTDSHNAYDVFISCSAIEDIPGSSGTYRYQFTAKVRSIEDVVSPV